MTLNRPHPSAVFAVLIMAAVAILLGAWLAGCARLDQKLFNEPTPAVDVTPAADKTAKSTEGVIKPLAAATQRAARLTPDNVEKERPSLLRELAAAWQAALQAVKDAAATAKVARESNVAATKLLEDVKDLQGEVEHLLDENGKLKEKINGIWHSLTAWVFGIGMFLSFCLTIFGAYLCFKMDFKNGIPAAGAGAAGLTVGILFMTMADFFEEYKLPIGIGLCIVVGLAIAAVVYLAYRRLNEDAVSGIKATQAAIATGILPLAEAAPVLNAVQTKRYKKLVNLNTPKKPKPSPAHHEIPVMSTTDTASNVTTAAPSSPAKVESFEVSDTV
jgi:hypothetical protein